MGLYYWCQSTLRAILTIFDVSNFLMRSEILKQESSFLLLEVHFILQIGLSLSALNVENLMTKSDIIKKLFEILKLMGG